jgi:hypothetical protein
MASKKKIMKNDVKSVKIASTNNGRNNNSGIIRDCLKTNEQDSSSIAII